MKNIAIILAGGIGSRSGLSVPKQFFKVAGETVIEHTITTFNNNNKIDEVWIIVHNQYVTLMESICLKNNWGKVKKILNGGAERYESSLSAINACDREECNLIFHDSVRPLVSNRIINEVIDNLEKYNAINVAIPVVDTIISKNGDYINDIPDRSTLLRGQTPQAFKLSVIRKAYELALQDKDFKTTDDCGVVKKYLPDEPIFIVSGEEKNMKLTNKEDIFILDKLFQLKSDKISKNLTTNSLSGKVAVVFGGSYGIGKCIVDDLTKLGCTVYSFSRSENGVDISNKLDVENSMSNVYAETGKIDFVVNTAALLKKEPLATMSDCDINSIIEVNFFGMVNVSKIAYQYLKESKGSLLLFTSSSYTRGRAFYSLYSSTKAAAVNFAQAISQEWYDDGVRVNCINPERTNTPMRVANFGHEDVSTLLAAEEVSHCSINVLLSEATGQVFDVKIK